MSEVDIELIFGDKHFDYSKCSQNRGLLHQVAEVSVITTWHQICVTYIHR